MPKSKPAKKKPSKPASPAKKPAKAAKPAAKAKVNKSAKPAKASKPAKAVKPAKAPAPAKKPAAAPAAKAVTASAADKNKPKGITIVDNKSPKKPMKAPKKMVQMPSLGAPLLAPGKKWKPLIQSGPNAPKVNKTGIDVESLKGKTPFGKKDLEHYKQILLKKRSELAGDVEHMEGQALMDSSGSLSHLPQHAAEQGSDAYDQSLSLDIAEVDRKLIREIDDAIGRIHNLSFGICEMSGKPISKERLEELPWTRYSIESARERERKMFYVPRSDSGSSPSRSSSSAE